jgi:hypothetical protein
MNDAPRETAPDLYSEPLLPIERRLIAGSLGLGLVLLAVLALANWIAPLR